VSQFRTAAGRRLVRPALAVTAALLVAGCSSGGDTTAAPSASTPSATTGSAAPAPAPATASGSAAAGTSGSPSASPSAGAGSSTAPAAGPDRCHTGELTATLTGGDSGAGQRGATVTLTNRGGRTCDVEGFGGVGLLDAAGGALPTDQVRQEPPAPALVTVAPGRTVTSQLQWTVVPGGGDPASGCPTPATLTVIPPDEQDSLAVAWTLGAVCGGGRLEQQAYVAG
jgi:hypothetical protein